MNRSLIEIASWSFATELVRQLPSELRIVEMHPGGGQYDCLSIFAQSKLLIHLNRSGSLHFCETADGSPLHEDSVDIWSRLAEGENTLELLQSVSGKLRLRLAIPVPPGNPRCLVYRTIAGFLKTTAFGPGDWRCVNDVLDTSDGSSGQRDDFRVFPEAQKRLADVTNSDVLANPAYRFWFLRHDGTSQACFEETGIVWFLDGTSLSLQNVYKSHGSLLEVVAKLDWKIRWAIAGRK